MADILLSGSSISLYKFSSELPSKTASYTSPGVAKAFTVNLNSHVISPDPLNTSARQTVGGLGMSFTSKPIQRKSTFGLAASLLSAPSKSPTRGTVEQPVS